MREHAAAARLSGEQTGSPRRAGDSPGGARARAPRHGAGEHAETPPLGDERRQTHRSEAEYLSGRERADEGSLCSREALPASRKDQLTNSVAH
jgi:hypothetical protein